MGHAPRGGGECKRLSTHLSKGRHPHSRDASSAHNQKSDDMWSEQTKVVRTRRPHDQAPQPHGDNTPVGSSSTDAALHRPSPMDRGTYPEITH